jgi:hypothetical protein
MPFWPPLLPADELEFNYHTGQHKLNLLNHFDSGIGTNMHKAAHPSGGMGSSNPRRWRCKRLHHRGDDVW